MVSGKHVIVAAIISAGAVALSFACVGGAACGPAFEYSSALPASATSCVLVASAGDASVTVAIGDMPEDAGCIGPGSPGSTVVACSCVELDGLVCWRSCQGQLRVTGDFDAAVHANGIFHDASATASLTCDDAAVARASTVVEQWMCAL